MDLRSKDAIESSKQHDIEMSNILIAEFMGIDQVDIDTYQETNSNLKYHSSWDWLMPVVEEIESDERYDVEILQYGTRILDNQKEIVNNIANISFDKKINHTYEAVVEFINQKNYTEVYTATCYKCNEEIEYTDVFSMCPLCLQAI